MSSSEDEDTAYGYLGRQLRGHAETAYTAFSELHSRQRMIKRLFKSIDEDEKGPVADEAGAP
jgi:hypothetical protein